MTAAVAQVIWLGLGAMVTCYLLIGTGYAAVHFAWESRMVLRVRDHHGPSPDPVPATPAYRSYPLRQAWRDARVLLGRAGRGWWEDLAGLHHRFWGWFRGTSAAKQLLSLPLGVSLVVGTALVVAPVAAGALTVLIGLTAGVLLWGVGLLLLAGTLGVADAALRVSHRIVVACPHPGCYHRFRRPAYACPADGCGQRHPALRPGRAGLLRHACRCGAALPTLMVLGRYRLTGYCPRCHRPLPRRAGRLRIEHVPVVGGPDAGKTTFLCLAIGALDQRITATGGVVEYTDERDQQRWRAALAALRGGERLPKTPVELPAAVMLETRPRRAPGRILYLFDPAGETFDAVELLDAQRYLDHAEVALVVVDPLAIPGVWRSLTPADHRELAQLAPAPPLVREGPGEMIDRLVGVLRTRPVGARLRRVLVVVSKSDVLRKTQVGQPLGEPEPDVRGWLEEVGWGNWVRALEDCGDQVRYLASGLDIDQATLTGAVDWLTSGGRAPGRGTRERRAYPGRWRGWWRPGWWFPPVATRPWVSPSRPDRIPRAHVAGRLVMQVILVPAALVTGLAALVATGGWLWLVIL